jgi:hypothetical protein
MTKYLKAPPAMIDLQDIVLVQKTYIPTWLGYHYTLEVYYGEVMVKIPFRRDEAAMDTTFELIAERLDEEII